VFGEYAGEVIEDRAMRICMNAIDANVVAFA